MMLKIKKKTVVFVLSLLAFSILTYVYINYLSPIRRVGGYTPNDDLGYAAYYKINSQDDNLFVLRNGNDEFSDKLLVFDISDRDKPKLISENDFSESMGSVVGMTIDNNYLFIISQTRGIVVMDISRPQSPQLATEYDLGAHVLYNSKLIIKDKVGYIRTVITDEEERDEQLYILSLENPLAITILSTIREGGNPLWIENYYLYTAAMRDEQKSARRYLTILDVSNSKDPIVVNRLFELESINDAAIQGGKLYLSGDDGFNVTSISDPASPLILGRIEWASDGIVVDKEYAYILHPWFVQVIDISDPNKPKIIDSESITQGRDFTLVDNYIYLVDSSDGLLVYKIYHKTPSFLKRLLSYRYKVQEWTWKALPD